MLWRVPALAALVVAVAPIVVTGQEPAAPRYVTTVGSVAPTGQLNDPWGLAVAPTDDEYIYVVDRGNARIQVFTPTGVPVGEWGSRGHGAGQFWDPTDVAVSPDGRYVYVVDRGHRQVKRFRGDKECFAPGAPDCFTGPAVLLWGGPGSGDNLFDAPVGVAVDAGGDVYVSDWAAHNVEVYSADGVFIRRIGEPGNENGQLMRPTDVEIGPAGKLWIADRDNDRIAFFERDGSYVGSWNAGGDLWHPTGLAVGTDGSFLVVDYEPSYRVPRVRRYSPDRRLLDGPLGLGGDFAPALYPLQGAALLSGGTAVLADPFAPENSLVMLPPGGSPFPLATRSRQLGQLDSPGGVAADPQFVAVSDVGNHRVLVLDPADGYRTSAVMGGVFQDTELPEPGGLAVHRYGSGFEDAVVYIASPENHTVFLRSPSGFDLGQWGDGSPGLGDEGLRGPSAVAVGPDGDVYIADTLNHRVVRRGAYPGGGFKAKIGQAGCGDGELTFPSAVAVGPGDLVYTLEEGNHRLQAFTPEGEWVHTWNQTDPDPLDGVRPGFLWFPKDLSADEKYLYVMEDDGLDHVRVQVLVPDVGEATLESSVIATFATKRGPGPGELWQAGGLAVSTDGDVVIADSASNWLQVFSWSAAEVPETPVPPASATATSVVEPTETLTSPTEAPSEEPTSLPTAEPTDGPGATPTQRAPALDTPPPNTQPTPPEAIFLPLALTPRR